MVHHLKTYPEYFKEVVEGNKTFEIRKDDRGFRVGDILHLQEYEPNTQKYTGRESYLLITYTLQNTTFLQPGYICMGIKEYLPF